MAKIHKDLIQLEAVGLIRLVQTHPELEYLFRHALVQEVAYRSLLREDRKKLHHQVGEAMEVLYSDRLEELASELGRHFGIAEDFEKAIHYLTLAGKQSVRQSANQEAITHFTQALTFLEKLPNTPERASQELQLQLALTGPLITMKGYGAPETVQAFDRARQLAAQTGDTSQVFPLLYGKWITHAIRAAHQVSREAAEQFLALAKQQPDAGMLVIGHRHMGLTAVLMGEFQYSQNHFEQALALFDPEQHQDLTFRFGQHPGVSVQGILAWPLWFLGYPDQALQSLKKAISMARELNHVNTSCYVLTYCACFVNLYCRDVEGVTEHAQAVIEIAKHQGIAMWLAYATVMEGWTIVERGQPEAGISQMHQGLTDLEATGSKTAFSIYWGLLAEGYADLGQTQEGLNIIDEALAFVEDSDERFWEADLHRLKGELLLAQAESKAEAEASFQQAIAIARQQEAR